MCTIITILRAIAGGDDALLKKFDNRVDNAPVAVNKQAGAGVTSIHCNKSKENFLVTGR